MSVVILFSNPDLTAMEAAHSDGLLNWHCEDWRNPYVIGNEPVSPLLAWAWEFGRRKGLYVYALRRRLTESDQVNRATLGKLKVLRDVFRGAV